MQTCERKLVKTCRTISTNGHHEQICYKHHVTKCALLPRHSAGNGAASCAAS